MVTLISYGNSEGTRRCDARCYDAVGATCICICGGANHAKGRKVAERQTVDRADEILEAAAAQGIAAAAETLSAIRTKRDELTGLTVRVAGVLQAALFDTADVPRKPRAKRTKKRPAEVGNLQPA